jgi:hypothetical protein
MLQTQVSLHGTFPLVNHDAITEIGGKLAQPPASRWHIRMEKQPPGWGNGNLKVFEGEQADLL